MTDILCYFCDEQIVVCEKPAGLLSEGEGEHTLPSLLRAQLDCEIYPVHRLDRDTTGLMVFAKTSRAAAALSRQITEGGFDKEYLALLCGTPAEPCGTLADLLFYDRQRGKSFVVSNDAGIY